MRCSQAQTPSRRLRQSVFGFFVQDDWRLRSDVTLNAGLRYEPTGDITEVDGKLSQLIDFASPTATLNDAEVVEAVVINPSKSELRAAPRLGLGRGRQGQDGRFAAVRACSTT